MFIVFYRTPIFLPLIMFRIISVFLSFKVSTKADIPSDWGEWKREAVVGAFVVEAVVPAVEVEAAE